MLLGRSTVPVSNISTCETDVASSNLRGSEQTRGRQLRPLMKVTTGGLTSARNRLRRLWSSDPTMFHGPMFGKASQNPMRGCPRRAGGSMLTVAVARSGARIKSVDVAISRPGRDIIFHGHTHTLLRCLSLFV